MLDHFLDLDSLAFYLMCLAAGWMLGTELIAPHLHKKTQISHYDRYA